MQVPVTIYSDFICPWCYIGERKLALAAKQTDLSPLVTYRPFELNPGTPPGGWLRRDYRVAKFGSWERSQMLDAQVAAAGRDIGLEFNYELVMRTPNTMLAHRLMWATQQSDIDGAALARLLFRAYFTEGLDISDPAILRPLVTGSGLPTERSEAVLTGTEGAADVRHAVDEAHAMGIQGVPFFRIGDRTVEGAQAVALLADALRDAADQLAAAA